MTAAPADRVCHCGKRNRVEETGKPPRARGRKAQGTDLFLLEKAGVDTCIGRPSAWPRARSQSRASAGVGRRAATCSRTCAGAALRSCWARGRHRFPWSTLPLQTTESQSPLEESWDLVCLGESYSTAGARTRRRGGGGPTAPANYTPLGNN